MMDLRRHAQDTVQLHVWAMEGFKTLHLHLTLLLMPGGLTL